MRLTFVHGMRQEGKEATLLREAWKTALHDAWSDAELRPPPYELEMPFYGDILDELTCKARGSSRVIARGPMPTGVSEDEEHLLTEYKEALAINDDDVERQLGQEVVARGPANWEWVQGIARAIERRVPLFSVIGLDFVQQVEAYLNRAHIREEVDKLVIPTLVGERTVVVAHSLGTIISYWLLRKAGMQANVPLFVTLGSPLGIAIVKERIQPPSPLSRPDSVGRWLNATDQRDYVALHARLDEQRFTSGIDNLSDVRNSKADPHSVIEYLSDRRVAKSIFAALTS